MILIDTNILVFTHNADSRYNKKATELIKSAIELKSDLCVAHQNLLEFFSVVTNPSHIETPVSPEKASSWIEIYLKSSSIKKICPSQKTLTNTIIQIKKSVISKAEIFDCYLVATMLENGVSTIYTDNISHFKKYPQIKAVNPLI